jgi:hypothetical protein
MYDLAGDFSDKKKQQAKKWEGLEGIWKFEGFLEVRRKLCEKGGYFSRFFLAKLAITLTLIYYFHY